MTSWRSAPRSTARLGVALAVLASVCLGPAAARPAHAQIQISNLSVFLNDFDVTVHVVLLSAIPRSLHESIHTGIATHVRFHVELWQYNRYIGVDRRLQQRTVERQMAYNLLTKEYKVVSLAGEQREPVLTKDLRDAQRVISELRTHGLAPAAALDPAELYYVRVRADVSLNGDNSWFARWTGNAEETPWVQSSLLTVTRRQ